VAFLSEFVGEVRWQIWGRVRLLKAAAVVDEEGGGCSFRAVF